MKDPSKNHDGLLVDPRRLFHRPIFLKPAKTRFLLRPHFFFDKNNNTENCVSKLFTTINFKPLNPLNPIVESILSSCFLYLFLPIFQPIIDFENIWKKGLLKTMDTEPCSLFFFKYNLIQFLIYLLLPYISLKSKESL